MPATEAVGAHPTGMHSCYRPQRSCEGYVFTGICLSTRGRGVCLSACWDTTHTHTPGADPPREQTPPGETATAADGTHPTGMHSCLS